MSEYLGCPVIVRANMAGVYCGLLRSIDEATDTVVLEAGARQLHYWECGGSCAQIAEAGIGGTLSRVTAPSSSALRFGPGAQVVQVCAMTDVAWERVQATPVWRGGM